jgi:hypothetical protein
VKNDSSKVGDVTDPPPYMPLNWLIGGV